jgi:hypothetical protein
VEGEDEEVVERGDWHGHREQERREAEKPVKACNVGVDSHYRDNNRMFQSHGETGPSTRWQWLSNATEAADALPQLSL